MKRIIEFRVWLRIRLRRQLELRQLRAATRFHGANGAVLVARDVMEPAVLAAKVSSALDHIGARGMPWTSLVTEHLHGFVIVAQDFSEYWPATGYCALSKAVVAKYPVAALASVIVHEAEHSRLYAGEQWFDQDARSRVEYSCVRKQLQFLEQESSLDRFIEVLSSVLQRPLATRREILLRRATALDRADIPRWVAKMYRILYRLPSSEAEYDAKKGETTIAEDRFAGPSKGRSL